MAKNIPPTEWAKKWADKTAASTADMRAGVMRVQTAPGEMAARQSQKWIDGLQEAFSSGRWQQAVRSVGLADWQQAFLQKALPIIGDRVRRAQPKVERFAVAWQSVLAQMRTQLGQLPRGSLDQNLQRANAVARLFAAQRGRYRQAGREEVAVFAT